MRERAVCSFDQYFDTLTIASYVKIGHHEESRNPDAEMRNVRFSVGQRLLLIFNGSGSTSNRDGL
jgi:hypothetical protein